MTNVKIITDSNSGITPDIAKEIGVEVVPMPFVINGEEYFEDINLTQEKFYELLENPNADIHTSQPSAYQLTSLWDKVLKENDSIVYIPMSSGLSASCQSAITLAQEYNGKVQVVNNQRISVTQKESVMEAIKLASLGKSAEEIKTYLEESKMVSTIFIMVDTLKYLKKGGRVTPAAAALGAMLRIKPLLIIKGEKLDSFFKALNIKQAKIKMLQTIKNELETVYAKEYSEGRMVLSIAHTNNLEEAMKFANEVRDYFPNVKLNYIDPLSLSVSCHIGPGSLALAVTVNNYQ